MPISDKSTISFKKQMITNFFFKAKKDNNFSKLHNSLNTTDNLLYNEKGS
jgi:hypothetical protein